MAVKIYGRAGCSQCEQTKLKFHREGKIDIKNGGNGEKFEYEYLIVDDYLVELETKYGVLPRTLPYIEFEDKMFNFAQVDVLIKQIKG